MNKIILIIQREYLSRVKKKSFIVLTFLVPLLFIGMIAATRYLISRQNDLGDKKTVEVVDESGMFANKLKNKDNIEYYYAKDNYATAKAGFSKSGYGYLLYIPSSATGAQLLSEKKASAITIQNIEGVLSEIAQVQRLVVAGIDTAVLAKAQKPITIDARQITDAGEKDAQTYVAYAIGFISAFLIYMSLFIYGSQVMRGVIEEKVSRVVEVIISSVKPFQLMIGKIIGIGLVGLTQFVLWIALSIILSASAGTFLMNSDSSAQSQQLIRASKTNIPGDANQTPANSINQVMQSVESIPLVYTIGCFLFYFLFGYLLYSAIFAAVGSAVDNETETQQFMLPITLPLVFTLILSMNFIINNPDSSLSVCLSMIPFTSPIAMMMRIPFGVPAWQLAASMLLLLLGFVFTTWVAARIYRVGILMYGKKATYKELAKWFMYIRWRLTLAA